MNQGRPENLGCPCVICVQASTLPPGNSQSSSGGGACTQVTMAGAAAEDKFWVSPGEGRPRGTGALWELDLTPGVRVASGGGLSEAGLWARGSQEGWTGLWRRDEAEEAAWD